MLYFGGFVMALVLFCMLICQTERGEEKAQSSSLTKERSTWKSLTTKDIRPNETERMKTPDELYEERYQQSANKVSSPFNGDEIVPPELLQLEQETANAEQRYTEEDNDIVPYELRRLEEDSGSNSSTPIEKDNKLVPLALQEIEKKTSEDPQNQTIEQDSKIVPKKLQRLEEKPISKISKASDISTMSDIIPEELQILEE